MRKGLFYSLISLFALTVACQSGTKTAHNCEEGCNDSEKKCCEGAYSVKAILDSAETFVGKEVKLKAEVVHVCCSGKNFKVADVQDSTKILSVKAGGEIERFFKSLVGNHVNITAVLQVNKRTQSMMEQTEMKFSTAIDSLSKIAEPDSVVLKKIENLTKRYEKLKAINQTKISWMVDNGKTYYPEYYMEAVKFADCCKKKNDPKRKPMKEENRSHCDHH